MFSADQREAGWLGGYEPAMSGKVYFTLVNAAHGGQFVGPFEGRMTRKEFQKLLFNFGS
jgi:hypothetical protein